MSSPIEDYALLGDMQTAALVSKSGSIDWLCFPRFDSPACFAALLGDENHGRWLLAPREGTVKGVKRRYREGTLILETEFTTDSGTVCVVDCMPPRGGTPDLVRVVRGVSGVVPMVMQLAIRFDYGSIVPWVRSIDGVLHAIAGPDALVLRTPVATHGVGFTTVAEFTVHAGEQVPFDLSWYPSHEAIPSALDALLAVQETESWWQEWAAHCTYRGPYREAVLSSAVTLKALTYEPTGGVLAAATRSLPEHLGGVRNWDYRYCWVRDATFTLYALLLSGFRDEACHFRDWLLRAVAGEPSRLQIMYGVAGERRLSESTLDWLPGYEGSAPVRVGNAAVQQFQLDVYGEVMDAMHQARHAGLESEAFSWALQRAMLKSLESSWSLPDEGIWEVRGPKQQFTHSKVMAWVAFDRGVKAIERFDCEGPLERWKQLRDTIRDEVLSKGYDVNRGAFTQAFGSSRLDASLLMMPLVGFLPAKDPRMLGTVRAIEKELMPNGLVLRYRTEEVDDGLPAGEATFLACSFWLADNYALAGRGEDARALFGRLLSLRNDVGLLAEQYEPVSGRLLGNFPQAFSHVGLINTAFNLTPRQPAPATERQDA